MVESRRVYVFQLPFLNNLGFCSKIYYSLGGKMTDLEVHVNQPGRDKLVKAVREKINELGITYIYFQFISVTGRIVGKGIPAAHWERTAEKGFQLVYGSTANLFIDRHGDYIGYGPEAMELVGIPDPETFAQLPGIREWQECIALVLEIEKKEKIQAHT